VREQEQQQQQLDEEEKRNADSAGTWDLGTRGNEQRDVMAAEGGQDPVRSVGPLPYAVGVRRGADRGEGLGVCRCRCDGVS
jgi:hypothetical protein